ncbi:MFS transporter [Paenibacillus thailandensis]|uniref:MFS transporter n=1 Tax=Paenibacillus thailandensis TaxID=393250 RepID=A0ABW5QRR3_9BACL
MCNVSEKEAPKAVSKVFIGISAGMIVGVPIASFMDNTFSYEWAMAFFLIVNALVFVATLLFVPSMPVKERLTYGSQFSVLKRPVLWISIVAVILINGSIFAVYSYLSEYLGTVSIMSPNIISLTLFIYGSANIIGNIAVGRLLTHSPSKAVFMFPLLLAAVYTVLLFTGQFAVSMIITTIFWGIVAGGIMTNINQYLIMSAAPQAPDFANGLFISACNVGTTVGAAVGGVFISQLGTPYVMLAGIMFLVLGFVSILIRSYMFSSARQLS